MVVAIALVVGMNSMDKRKLSFKFFVQDYQSFYR
jgi:hypothetical protein